MPEGICDLAYWTHDYAGSPKSQKPVSKWPTETKQFGKDKIDGIVDIMVETLLSVGTVNIGRNQLPAEQVKNVFRKINMEHIRYIFDCIEETSREKKIRNMKNYLLTALSNAPMTIDAYYASESNYDYHNRGEN